MIAAELANIERGQVGQNHEKSDGQICTSEAASKLNVSERSMKTAKKVKREAKLENPGLATPTRFNPHQFRAQRENSQV